MENLDTKIDYTQNSSEGLERCENCAGTGQKTHDDGKGHKYTYPCPECDGEGWIKKDK